ncbi:MAG: methyltransferase domain-containing protein [Chryseolinea sp.]
MNFKGLYVNHKRQKCGVYEFGKTFGELLLGSEKFPFSYCECDSLSEFINIFNDVKPTLIIYNHHPSTMPWVQGKGAGWVPLKYRFQAIHVGTIHEVYQGYADKADSTLFDFHIAADPTLLLKNPLVYKTGRLLPKKAVHVNRVGEDILIGSFGFATPGKGFEKIIDLVEREFDKATIRLNIPFAKFGDADGSLAKQMAQKCRDRISKPDIRLEVNHDYLEKDDLLYFLGQNTVNIFLYDDMPNRGISSAADWAISAGRPIAISNSRLFRHFWDCKPSICVDDSSLKTIIKDDGHALIPLYNEFTPEIILWQFESIFADILSKFPKHRAAQRTPIRYFGGKIYRRLRKVLGLKNTKGKVSRNVWTKENDQMTGSRRQTADVSYVSVESKEIHLNGILDNSARERYRTTIEFLETNLAELISKKIPEANVQQAFVLDTTVRLAKKVSEPKILAVGAFEDTAVEALKLLGFNVTAIDPVLNFDLSTYRSKPGVSTNMFDIVVSTSVIEHVKDDEQFVQDISALLKPGGVAILTCDYKDDYVPGDAIPQVDFRFYTQRDIKDRLLRAIPECELVDAPKWDCINPDFVLNGVFRYTFASIVFQKRV